jgi:hypothetical protein
VHPEVRTVQVRVTLLHSLMALPIAVSSLGDAPHPMPEMPVA